MDKRDSDLDRLLRAAAQEDDSPAQEMPFGFDTRVIATWRSQRSQSGSVFWELAPLFRRIALGATVLMACASAGAFWQVQQNNELDEPTANAYAIADSVIEAGAWQ